jgi:hypothetical protein
MGDMFIHLDRIGWNEPWIQVKIQCHGYWLEQQAVKKLQTAKEGDWSKYRLFKNKDIRFLQE